MQNVPTIKLSEEATLLSHLVDLGSVQLADTGNAVWLQYLPLGLYDHPVHGEINITPQRIANFVKNFNDKVREQDLDVDYEHKQLDTKAAGWIKAAEDRGPEGLWVQVDFTDPAMQALRNKEYKYFSAEFADAWKHPKTKTKHKDVMFGGALTNRPFIKDIMPINLSELLGEPHKQYDPNQGVSMDPKLKASLIKLYKLSEDATDEQVAEAVEAGAPAPVEPKAETDDEKKARLIKEAEELGLKVDEAVKEPELAQLSELAKTNPALQVLLAEREETRTRMQALEVGNKLSETTIKLNAMNETGKFAIPPAVHKTVRDLVVRLNDKDGEDVLALLKQFTDLGLVELGERGRTREPGTGSEGEDFTSRIMKLAEKDGIDFVEASLQIAAQDPEGFAAYRSESTMKA
jgi:hypothetical protein